MHYPSDAALRKTVWSTAWPNAAPDPQGHRIAQAEWVESDDFGLRRVSPSRKLRH